MKGGSNHHRPEPPKVPKLPPNSFTSPSPKPPLHALDTCHFPSTIVERALQIGLYYAKQTQSQKPQNHHKLLCHSDLPQYSAPIHSRKQTQSNPISRYAPRCTLYATLHKPNQTRGPASENRCATCINLLSLPANAINPSPAPGRQKGILLWSHSVSSCTPSEASPQVLQYSRRIALSLPIHSATERLPESKR